MAKSSEAIAFLNIDSGKLNKAANMLRAIAHPLRMKILAYIDKNKSVQVNKIYNTLNLEQSVASQHLKILRNGRYVTTRRNGKFIYYSLNYDAIIHALTLIEKYKLK